MRLFRLTAEHFQRLADEPRLGILERESEDVWEFSRPHGLQLRLEFFDDYAVFSAVKFATLGTGRWDQIDPRKITSRLNRKVSPEIGREILSNFALRAVNA